MNTNLEAIENTSFYLGRQNRWKVCVPESVQIVYNEEAYILNQTELGVFEYEFLTAKIPN